MNSDEDEKVDTPESLKAEFLAAIAKDQSPWGMLDEPSHIAITYAYLMLKGTEWGAGRRGGREKTTRYEDWACPDFKLFVDAKSEPFMGEVHRSYNIRFTARHMSSPSFYATTDQIDVHDPEAIWARIEECVAWIRHRPGARPPSYSYGEWEKRPFTAEELVDLRKSRPGPLVRRLLNHLEALVPKADAPRDYSLCPNDKHAPDCECRGNGGDR